MIDYFKILGIEPTKDKDEIKKAFRRLAHIHHPDKGGDKNKFQEILNAYEVLTKAVDNPEPQSFHGHPVIIVVDIDPNFWYNSYGYYGGTTASNWDRTN